MKLCLPLLMASFSFSVAAVQPATINAWSIVVAEDASPSEQYAAEEFRDLYRLAMGVELDIVHDVSVVQNAVFIGGDPEKFSEEQLNIQVRADAIHISGGRPRGTLYGVYEFFERYFGCEFLTCDQTWFPDKAEIKPLPEEDYTYTPPFSFRWSYYKENSDHPAFAVRNRINTIATDERLGGKTPQNLIGHSYYKWISPEKYGQTHPEYFAMVDGARQLTGAGGGPQPCVSNPEVIEIVARGVLDELKQNPIVRNITVSQNDNGAYCHCDACEAINQREESPMAANLMLVNAVAERVEQSYPDVMVGTLAYWYSRKPPKNLKPRTNVQIQLCSIECCSLHPINDPACKLNHSFCEDLTGWKALSNEIWIWNYNTNFSYYDLPFPNLKSIGPNVQFFLDNHAKGVFMQANGNGNTGELCDLRNYVISKCLWKPGRDSWELAQHFCRLHYGPAAEDIIAYLEFIHRNAEEKGFHPDCGPTPERLGITHDVAQQALGYFTRALENVADDTTLRERVEKASISVYKALLLTSDTSWHYDNGSLTRILPDAAAGILDRYTALCAKYNMTKHNEGTPLSEFLKKFSESSTLPAARIENSVWRITATPDKNAAIAEMFHKPTGRDMLHAMKTFDLEKGILETFAVVGPYRRTPDLRCSVETTANTLTMRKELPDGSLETRSITLPEDAPETIRVDFSIQQGGILPRTWRFNSQTGFDPGTQTSNADILSVYVDSDGWKQVNRDWLIDDGPDAGLMDTPTGGRFAFFNHDARFGALLAFDPARIGKVYLFWHPERPQLNMDIRTPTVELQPGQSLDLSYTIHYLDSFDERGNPSDSKAEAPKCRMKAPEIVRVWPNIGRFLEDLSPAPDLATLPVRTDLKEAIALGTRHMNNLFDRDRDNEPFFYSNCMADGTGKMFHSVNIGIPHVVGRCLLACMMGEIAAGVPFPEDGLAIFERYCKSSFDNPDNLNSYLDPEKGNARFIEFHNMREGLYGLWALAACRNSAWAREKGHAMLETLDRITDSEGRWSLQRIEELGMKERCFGVSVPNATRLVDALLAFYDCTQDPLAMKLAELYARRGLAEMYTPEGHFAPMPQSSGHVHSITSSLSGIAAYAARTGNHDMLEACRRIVDTGVPEYFSSWGWGDEVFPDHPADVVSRGEINQTGDVVRTALILGDAGYPHYYELAERYLRSMLLPTQHLEAEMRGYLKDKETPADDSERDVLDRTIGGYAMQLPNDRMRKGDWPLSTLDITSGAVHAMSECWRHRVDMAEDVCSVNLLLDCDNDFVAIHSALPFEGRLDFSVKKPLTALRMALPPWLDVASAHAIINDSPCPLSSQSGYLELGTLNAGDHGSLSFDVPCKEEKETVDGIEYTTRWIGSQIVEIQPRGEVSPLPW